MGIRGKGQYVERAEATARQDGQEALVYAILALMEEVKVVKEILGTVVRACENGEVYLNTCERCK